MKVTLSDFVLSLKHEEDDVEIRSIPLSHQEAVDAVDIIEEHGWSGELGLDSLERLASGIIRAKGLETPEGHFWEIDFSLVRQPE